MQAGLERVARCDEDDLLRGSGGPLTHQGAASVWEASAHPAADGGHQSGAAQVKHVLVSKCIMILFSI